MPSFGKTSDSRIVFPRKRDAQYATVLMHRKASRRHAVYSLKAIIYTYLQQLKLAPSIGPRHLMMLGRMRRRYL